MAWGKKAKAPESQRKQELLLFRISGSALSGNADTIIRLLLIPPAAATAAAVSATAAVSTAAAIAATVSTATAGTPVFCFLHYDVPSIKFLVVQLVDRILRFLVIWHFHKAKALGFVCKFIHNNFYGIYLSEFLERML